MRGLTLSRPKLERYDRFGRRIKQRKAFKISTKKKERNKTAKNIPFINKAY